MSDSEATGSLRSDSKASAYAEATIISDYAQDYVEQVNQRIRGAKYDPMRHESVITASGVTKLGVLGLDLAAAEFRHQGFEADILKLEFDIGTIYRLGIAIQTEISLG